MARDWDGVEAAAAAATRAKFRGARKKWSGDGGGTGRDRGVGGDAKGTALRKL